MTAEQNIVQNPRKSTTTKKNEGLIYKIYKTISFPQIPHWHFFYIIHNNVCWLRLSRPHPYFLGCYVICSIIWLFQVPESRAWYFGAQWPPGSHFECSSSNLRNWYFCSQKECILNSCIKLKQLEVKFIFVVMGIKLRFLWWTNAISMTPIYRPQRVLVSGCLLYLLYSFFKVLSL